MKTEPTPNRTKAEAHRTQRSAEEKIKCFLRVPPRPLRLCVLFFLYSVAFIPFAGHAATTNLTALLQQGLFEEQANRNLDAAIENYATLAKQFDKDRQLAATAVFRLGECYRAQGKTNEAAAQYQRILRDFADQQTLVTLSQQNLAGMGTQTGSSTSQARQQQKELLTKQIALAESDLVETQKLVQVGKATAAESRTAEKEVLRLRQQLAALDANRTEILDLSVPASSEEDQEIARIRRMIQNSPDLINAASGSPGSFGTPLGLAAGAGRLRVAAFLLDNGADVNGGGVAPISVAAAAGNRAMVELLLSRGADVNAKGDFDKTPLLMSVEKKFSAVTEVLLANKADVNMQDRNGKSPLAAAVVNRQVKTTQSLLAAGANPNLENRDGRTPFSFAAESGSPEIVKMFLAAKADPNGGKLDVPLLAAIHAKDVATAELLLQAGANPNVSGSMQYFNNIGMSSQVRRDQITPLWVAVYQNQPAIVQLILKFKADPDDAQTDGRAVIFRALDKPETLTALLDAGAKVDALDETDISNLGCVKQTPLMLAVLNNKAEAVELLLKHGANPNARDSAGNTPLHWAASYNLTDEKILRLLLDYKADPNVQNQSGSTPMDYLNAAIKDSSKRNFASVAMKNELAEKLIALLRQHGALDEMPDFTRIRITRQGLSQPLEVFRRGSQLTNKFTLLETVMSFYSRPQVYFSGQGNREAWQGLPFPDFGRVIIRRPSQKPGGKEQEIKVSLLNSSNVVDCARDVPVEFGDVIEIPESVHALNAAIPNPVAEVEWNIRFAEAVTGVQPGSFSERLKAITGSAPNVSPYRTAAQCLQKSIQLVVAGEPTTFKLNSWKEGFLSQALAKTEARSVLRSSSDLARVTVTRKTGKSAEPAVFTVDVSGSSPNINGELWLQDGDVIEVPEKR